MKFAIALTIALVVLLVAACDETAYKVGNLGADYSVVKLPYQGGLLTCITRGADDSHLGGISCDFVEFHGRKQ